ncbi:hypothetical protein AB1Y20_003324 [Prymnesium parvum]|uniref:Uncharacterized protein n=1 Tax=Prymnesium parvum TaxID=97485 RepID=A0AB34JBV6_PRYPA
MGTIYYPALDNFPRRPTLLPAEHRASEDDSHRPPTVPRLVPLSSTPVLPDGSWRPPHDAASHTPRPDALRSAYRHYSPRARAQSAPATPRPPPFPPRPSDARRPGSSRPHRHAAGAHPAAAPPRRRASGGMISETQILTTVWGEPVAASGAIAVRSSAREGSVGYQPQRSSQRCVPRDASETPRGAVYATVLHSLAGGRKVAMRDEERKAFFLTGVDPHRKSCGGGGGARGREARGEMEGMEDRAAAVVAAAAHEMQLAIGRRAQARARKEKEEARTPVAFDRLRARLQRLLQLLRLRTFEACQALRDWRQAKKLQQQDSTIPEEEIIFAHGGANYLLSLTFDCSFLPIPWDQDPMLLRWFDDAIDWILEHSPAEPRKVNAGDLKASIVAATAMFRVATGTAALPSNESHSLVEQGGVPTSGEAAASLQNNATEEEAVRIPSTCDAAFSTSPPDHRPWPTLCLRVLTPTHLYGCNRHLRSAQKMIEREAQRCVGPMAATIVANSRARHSESCRWRWAAYQVLLYGSECYDWLLEGHHAYSYWLRSNEAATYLQRRYRGRLAMRFAQLPTEMERLQQEKAEEHRALILARWRLYFVKKGPSGRHLSVLERMALKSKDRSREQQLHQGALRIQSHARARFAAKRAAKVAAERFRNERAVVHSLDTLISDQQHARMQAALETHRTVRRLLWLAQADAREGQTSSLVADDWDAMHEAEWFKRTTADLRATEQVDTIVECMGAVSAGPLTLIASGWCELQVKRTAKRNVNSLLGFDDEDVWVIYRGVKRAQVEATRRTSRIRGEITAWSTLREIASAEPISIERLEGGLGLIEEWTKELNSAQAELEMLQASMKTVACILGNGNQPVSGSQALRLLRGAASQLAAFQQAGAPWTVGQHELLSFVTSQVEEGMKNREQLAKTADKVAKCEGMLAGLRQLQRLHEALEARFEVLYDTRMTTFMLPAPELSSELSPNLPAGPNDQYPTFSAWRQFALTEHTEAQKRLELADTRRDIALQTELIAAEQAQRDAENKLKEVDKLMSAWLSGEGGQRIISSVHWVEGRLLRRILTHKRSELLRQNLRSSNKPRVRIKLARLSLVKTDAELGLAKRMLETEVQHIKHVDATCTLHLWDPQGLPCLEAATDPLAKATLQRQLHYFLGMGVLERPECPRDIIAATAPGQEDDHSPQAVRVTLGVNKFAAKTKTVDEILHELKRGVKSGDLAETFGVLRTAIYGCETTAYRQERSSAPTLLALQTAACEELAPKVGHVVAHDRAVTAHMSLI